MKSSASTKRAIAVSALALTLAAGQAISGGLQEWQITFNIDSGTLAGQSFTGTLSYDQAVLNKNFTDGVLSAADGEFAFSVTLPNGVTLTLADDPGAFALFQGFELVGLNYLGDNFADAALNTFDVPNDINNTFEVFADFDFKPDGFGTFSFKRLTGTDAQTAAFDWTNTDIDDTDILSTPGDGNDDDENTNFEGELEVSVDLDDGPGSFNPRQILIRFNDIMGNGPGQIPLGSTILGAVFRVEIISPGSGFTAHRLLTDWDVDTITWNTFNFNGEGGVQADDVEAVSTPDDQRLGVGGTVLAVDLTASLQAFADGATNHGFALLPVADGTDGVDFWTSEAPIGVPLEFFPPLLVVELADGTTRTFQEGINGYMGTSDTTLQEGQPDTNFGSLNTTSIDLNDGGFQGQYLLRFDGIFGTEPGQIDPSTDVVTSATVTVRSTSRGEDVSVYELNFEFDESRDTWNSVGGGINPDQVIEPFIQMDGDPANTAGFSANGMVVDNPGVTGLGTPIGIGVEDRYDDSPEPDAGFLLVSRAAPGNFAVRSTEPDIVDYKNYEVIEFYLRDVGDADSLEIRVGVGNDSNFWVSNDGFVPGAEWSRAAVDLTDASKWTQVIGSGTFTAAIAAADRLQFRHETMPILDGQDADDATGDIGIDRLTFCREGEVRCPTADFVNTRFESENPAYSEMDGDDFITFNLTESLQRFAAEPALNLGWAFLPESTDGFDFDAEGTLQPPAGPQLFVSYIPPDGCNSADLAEPFGTLDLADITAFITAFTAQDPAADLAEPFGTYDLADITTFITEFNAGCP
jgi:hypothetical protein